MLFSFDELTRCSPMYRRTV